jgi:ribonucleoside-diphosphate reductase alpha chain
VENVKVVCAIYIETWHADIFDFDLKEYRKEMRARDLFFAMWTSDLFMKRTRRRNWTLMCPNECPGFSMCMETSLALYESYEKAGKGRKTIA